MLTRLYIINYHTDMSDKEAIKNPLIIGLTGSFGSGCSYIAEHVLEKRGYKVISLSEILKKMYQEETKKDPKEAKRHELQDFGDKVREDPNRGPRCFAEKGKEKIEKGGPEDKWVVDSIRNPAEIHALREFSRNFFLFGVYADVDQRWGRVKDKYDNDRRPFDEDDKRDKGENSASYGQRVGDCFSEGDIIISNNEPIAVPGNDDFKKLNKRSLNYIELAERPLSQKQPIRKKEALMAMAYAVSQQSSCIQRKVGAIIVDEYGNVISSGYNEVPMHEKPCMDEYTECYRKKSRDNFFDKIKDEVDLIDDQEEKIRKIFHDQFRILDCCRALHAEENAIVNLARNGCSVSLKDCMLYTTTYPCRLCANKIVNMGIKRIIYLEPYPDIEAKAILKGEVEDKFFEGVTFRAYFRIYGDKK